MTPPRAVLFPIDREGRPVGDDVYVPEDLLEALLARIERSPTDGASYALTDAKYEVVLSRDESPPHVRCSSCTLAVRFRCFDRLTTVSLPLARAGAIWPSQRPRLDEQLVELTWSDDETACLFVCHGTGHHEIRIDLEPRIIASDDANGLRIALPPFPLATASISYPSSLGEPLLLDDSWPLEPSGRGRLRVRIPKDGMVSMQWPGLASQSTSAIQGQTLSWLHIGEDSAVLQYEVNLEASRSPLGSLDLELSPRLERLALPADSPIDEVERFAGAPPRMRIHFRPDAPTPSSFSLDFRLRRDATTGLFPDPNCRIAGGSETSDIFAVSVDDQLTARAEAASGL
ncbi:MAG: hypothetical protein AAF961_17700, partial [Planctomycetota bacterium]